MPSKSKKKAPVRKNMPTKTSANKAPLTRASQSQSRTGIPTIRQGSKPGSMLVKHSEYVYDVLGSNGAAFTVVSNPLNPGLSGVYRWLANLAFCFESYSIKGFTAWLRSDKGSAVDGYMAMAFDYDVSDSAPTNKQDMLSYWGAVRGPIWQDLRCNVDIAAAHKLGPDRYLRYGGIPASTDLKLYDFATLYVGVGGTADANVIAELVLEYEIEFHTPQVQIGNLTSAVTNRVLTGPSPTKANPFTGASLFGGNLNVTLGPNSITFGRTGQYEIVLDATGTGLTAAPSTSGSTVTVQGDPYFNVFPDATGAFLNNVFQVNVTQPGQKLQLNYTAVATTLTQIYAAISPFLYGV